MARKAIGKHTGRLNPQAMRRLQAESTALMGAVRSEAMEPFPPALVEARLLDVERATLKRYATHLLDAIVDGSYERRFGRMQTSDENFATAFSELRDFVDDWKSKEGRQREMLLATAEGAVQQSLSAGESADDARTQMVLVLKQKMNEDLHKKLTDLAAWVDYPWSLDDAIADAKEQESEAIAKANMHRARADEPEVDTRTWKEEMADLKAKLASQQQAARTAQEALLRNKRVFDIADWMEKSMEGTLATLDFIQGQVADYDVSVGGNAKRRLHEWLGKETPNEELAEKMNKQLRGGHADLLKILKNFDAYSAEIEQAMAPKSVDRGGFLSRISSAFGQGRA